MATEVIAHSREERLRVFRSPVIVPLADANAQRLSGGKVVCSGCQHPVVPSQATRTVDGWVCGNCTDS